MAPLQIVLKHQSEYNTAAFLWSRVYHGYKGRRVEVTLLSYHLRFKKGSDQEFPVCPFRIDFKSPPDEAQRLRTFMIGENAGQSGNDSGWNASRYENENMGFFIPNGNHGGEGPGFLDCSFAPMKWVVDLLENDVFCSLTYDTNKPWEQGTPSDPTGGPANDICDNVLYCILNFDIRTCGFCDV